MPVYLNSQGKKTKITATAETTSWLSDSSTSLSQYYYDPKLIKSSEVVADSIGREGGVWPVIFRSDTTDGPGQLRVLQLFRARLKTASQAWTGPTTACYQRQPD